MEESAVSIDALAPNLPIPAEQIALDRDTMRAESLFSAGFDNAVVNLFPKGGTGRDAPDFRVTFGGVGTSEVDIIRSDMISDATRPGVDPQSARLEISEAERSAQMVNALNLNMSNYQVAWNVLQGIRQDVQQLLRGS